MACSLMAFHHGHWSICDIVIHPTYGLSTSGLLAYDCPEAAYQTSLEHNMVVRPCCVCERIRSPLGHKTILQSALLEQLPGWGMDTVSVLTSQVVTESTPA